MKKILISTGGTGGHVIPAQVISDHLKINFGIIFTSDTRGLKYFKDEEKIIRVINTPQLNINFFFIIKIFKLFYLTLKSFLILKKENIDKVISTGGYMSLPICIAAKFSGIKIYLFEPNMTLGRANKFFLNFAEKIFCYSDSLRNFPKKFLNKLEVIKPLVNKSFYEIKKTNNSNKKNFCILIFGGSQGATIFNTEISKAIVTLKKDFPIKVIQQTKNENIENLRNFYNLNKIENRIFNFEKNIIELISESDLCISRAGATSLAEISILNKPFITIPLPTAKDNHQMHNAEFYEKAGCCWILDQKDLNYKNFLSLLHRIVKDKSEYDNKKNNLEKLNYQNLWNNINLRLNKIINEN